jgi:hypothetical protein
MEDLSIKMEELKNNLDMEKIKCAKLKVEN